MLRYYCQNCEAEGHTDKKFTLCPKCEGIMICFHPVISEKIKSGDTEEITVDHESGPFGILDYFNQDGEI